MAEGVKPERTESLIKPLKATASALGQIHNEKRVAEAEVGKCLVKVEKKKANSGNWEGGLGEEVWEHGWENSGFKGVVGERKIAKTIKIILSGAEKSWYEAGFVPHGCVECSWWRRNYIRNFRWW